MKHKSQSSDMEHFTVNLDCSQLRIDYLDGEKHLVAPVVLMTAGVHAGSRGALLYRKKELEDYAPAWNHKPIVLNHPKQGIACTRDFLNANKMGVLLATGFTRGKQRAEAWFNERRTAQVSPRVLQALRRREMQEVSTGLFVDQRGEPGEYHGKQYKAVAANHKPDHLAVLPDSEGACSIADGGGLFQLNAGKRRRRRGVKNYDASEERDYHGRWSGGSGSGAPTSKMSTAEIFELVGEAGGKKIVKTPSATLGVSFKTNPRTFHRNLIEMGYEKDKRETFRSHNGQQEHTVTHYSDGEHRIKVEHIVAAGYSGGYRESILTVNGKRVRGRRSAKVHVLNTRRRKMRTSNKISKKEFVTKLIKNEQTSFEEKDRKWLMNMDPASLRRLLPPKAARVFKTEEELEEVLNERIEDRLAEINRKRKKKERERDDEVRNKKKSYSNDPTANDDDEDDEDDFDSPAKKKKDKKGMSKNRRKSLKEFLENEVPDELRPILNQALRAAASEEEKLIKIIVANKSSKFKAEDLKKLAPRLGSAYLDHLRGLAAMATNAKSDDDDEEESGTASYFGAASPTSNTADTDDDGEGEGVEDLPLPVYNNNRFSADLKLPKVPAGVENGEEQMDDEE